MPVVLNGLEVYMNITLLNWKSSINVQWRNKNDDIQYRRQRSLLGLIDSDPHWKVFILLPTDFQAAEASLLLKISSSHSDPHFWPSYRSQYSAWETGGPTPPLSKAMLFPIWVYLTEETFTSFRGNSHCPPSRSITVWPPLSRQDNHESWEYVAQKSRFCSNVSNAKSSNVWALKASLNSYFGDTFLYNCKGIV